MNKVRRTIVLVTIGISLIVSLFVIRRIFSPDENISTIELPERRSFTQTNLSALIPAGMTVDDSIPSRTLVKDANVEITFHRTIFSDKPEETGGDFCGSSYSDQTMLKKVGLLNTNTIFIDQNKEKPQISYFANRFGIYCSSMPLFTKKYPDKDSLDIFYVFKQSVSKETELYYADVIDQIVLSLKDEMK